MKICKRGQVNDMPWGWQSESKLNKIIYDMWWDMWERVYSDINYFGCLIYKDWKYLSHYVKWIECEPNFINLSIKLGGYSVDKDIKLGNMRYYSPSTCTLVTFTENSSDVNNRKDCYKAMHTSTSRVKSSRSRKVALMGISTSKVLLFFGINDVKKFGFTSTSVRYCLNSSRKIYKGYAWYYLNYKHNKIYRIKES